MGKYIKKLFRSFSNCITVRRSVFDYYPVPSLLDREELEKRLLNYPTLEEAWAKDWENIGKDFRRAVARFEAEYVKNGQ